VSEAGDLAKAAAVGMAAGVVGIAVGGEAWGHESLAHRTAELHPVAAVAGDLCLWALGVDIATTDVGHRKHHATEMQHPVRSLGVAFVDTMKDIYVTRKQAQEILRDTSLHGYIMDFGMDRATDPLLEYDNETPTAIKRGHWPGKLFGRVLPEPAGRLAVPAAIIGIGGQLAEKAFPGKGRQMLLAGYAGYAAFSLVAALIPGVAEYTNGGDGKTVGRDIMKGSKALSLIMPWVAFRHGEHHENPAKRRLDSEPAYSSARLVMVALDKLGLARPTGSEETAVAHKAVISAPLDAEQLEFEAAT